jgi:hypothetical protein
MPTHNAHFSILSSRAQSTKPSLLLAFKYSLLRLANVHDFDVVLDRVMDPEIETSAHFPGPLLVSPSTGTSYRYQEDTSYPACDSIFMILWLQ